MMHIGLLGFGVVGGGVWALCAPRDDLNVKRVLLRSPKEGLPEEVVTFNADDILNDPEIDTVVEVMAGCTRPMNMSPPRWRGARMWSRPTRH